MFGFDSAVEDDEEDDEDEEEVVDCCFFKWLRIKLANCSFVTLTLILPIKRVRSNFSGSSSLDPLYLFFLERFDDDSLEKSLVSSSLSSLFVYEPSR